MKLNVYDKNKSGIYIIKNLINDKVYIGKAKCIYKRIKSHITALNTKNLKCENEHLINAWHKYGKLNFEYCVLEYLPLDNTLISQKEIEYIDKYNSINAKQGYNKRYDSETGLIVSKETRLKLSISGKKRYINNPELRLNVSINSSNFWKNNPEIKENMKKKLSTIKQKYKIGQFEYGTCKIIQIFENKQDLIQKYPNYYFQAILGCCNGTKKSYNKYTWKYIDIKTNQIVHRKYSYKKVKI